MAENTAAIKAEDRAAAGAIIAADAIASKSVHKDDLAAFVTDEGYTKKKDEAYNKYMETDIADWLGIGTSEGKGLWEKYAKETGIDKLNGYEVTNYTTDNEVEYKYYDENGTEQTKTITLEQMAATLAAKDAEKKTQELGQSAAEILKNTDRQTVKLLAGVKTKDMSQVTMGTLAKGGDYSDLSVDELHALGFTGDYSSIMKQINDAQQA
jgi:hypothetical protein